MAKKTEKEIDEEIAKLTEEQKAELAELAKKHVQVQIPSMSLYRVDSGVIEAHRVDLKDGSLCFQRLERIGDGVYLVPYMFMAPGTWNIMEAEPPIDTVN